MVMIFFVQLNNANTLLFNKILERLFCSKIYGSVFRPSGKKKFINLPGQDNILPGQDNYALICPGKITAH